MLRAPDGECVSVAHGRGKLRHGGLHSPRGCARQKGRNVCALSRPAREAQAPCRLSQWRPAANGRHGQALMLDPRLLLLDEPTAGLSPMLVGGMLEKIVEIHRTGVAMLIVEQNARQALHGPTVGMSWPWGKIATRTLARRCSRTQKSAPCSWVAASTAYGCCARLVVLPVW